MKFKIVLIISLFALFFNHASYADIVRSQLTSAIEAREPTNDLNNHVVGQPQDITTVYYFNHLTNMAGKTLVHKWLLNGEEKAVLNLSVGSNNWRTYSSKRMNGTMQGDWQIQVWVDGQQLQTHKFMFQIAQ